MKTILSRNQYRDDQIAGIVDSLIFGHLQRKQYSKTLNALLSESAHLMKDATTMPNAPNQICLNVNSFLHDQNLEQIIETFYTYGRFDVSSNMLELGKKLRDLTNEFSTELAFGCHSYSNNEQRLYGRKLRTRMQASAMPVNQSRQSNDASKRVEYSIDQVAQSAIDSVHHNDSELQYCQAMDTHETISEDPSSHENAHPSRRKAAQPLKQSQRAKQYLVEDIVKLSNDNLRDKDVGVDNSSFMIDPFLEVDNFNEILKSVVDGEETLYETLETFEREEAMEADQNSRDSMNQSGGNAALALDVPMHEDLQSTPSMISPLSRHSQSIPSHPHNTFSMLPSHNQSHHHVYNPMDRHIPRPLIEQYIQHPSMSNPMESQVHNASLPPFMPPPPPPNPPPVDSHPRVGEKKSSRDARESSWTKNGPPPPPPHPLSLPKTRLPSSIHTPTSSLPSLPPTSSSSLGTTSKLNNLGRIPKKGQSSTHSVVAPSPSASPRAMNTVPVVESSNVSDGFGISKVKMAPLMNGNNGRRDSMDSQDTMRAESVGESDCTMTENEDNDQPSRKEGTKTEREKKTTWDDLFEDAPSTVEESSREKEKLKTLQENKRRVEMKELEKKREREKRRKDKEKKEEDKRDRSKDDKSRHDKRFGDDRRRDSIGREEKMEKERERERDKERKIEMNRRQLEEQKRIIEATLKQKEVDERARQKKIDEEERKKELKEKEDEKRREKERDLKKIEDEKLRKEREIKSKEERRNELERRRRKELQLKKTMVTKPPVLFGDSPLDKIAAEMDGKELRKENDYETASRASSRVMEISSGVARNRPLSLQGSLHSSKTGIYLDKAQKLRETTEKPPPEARRPIRPTRVQMAPMKRPPTAIASEDESDEEEEESPPIQKRGKLEDNKINNILNKLYQ